MTGLMGRAYSFGLSAESTGGQQAKPLTASLLFCKFEDAVTQSEMLSGAAMGVPKADGMEIKLAAP